MKKIPVMRPLLPDADSVYPYLKKIDENRWYSNFGPLNAELEERVEDHFGLDRGCVATMSSGTSALVTSVRALNLPRGAYCALPSWTFIATAGGVYNSDLIPFFVDVDNDSWGIEPEQVMHLKDRIACVVVVAPYGCPINIEKWEDFKIKTGVQVIIDAAAAFDSFKQSNEFRVSSIPVVISLHATKPFGCGEGGLIICEDKEMIFKIKKMSNFGFTPEGIIVRGSNSKMSEYVAAVAHAELDGWEEKRKKWLELSGKFIEKLKSPNIQIWNKAMEYASSTFNIRLSGISAEEAIIALRVKGIEARRWWKKGVHNFEPYKDFYSISIFD
jgi:dTDP-4-amino-4,6-dideoxygalactose transaminase